MLVVEKDIKSPTDVRKMMRDFAETARYLFFLTNVTEIRAVEIGPEASTLLFSTNLRPFHSSSPKTGSCDSVKPARQQFAALFQKEQEAAKQAEGEVEKGTGSNQIETNSSTSMLFRDHQNGFDILHLVELVQTEYCIAWGGQKQEGKEVWATCLGLPLR